MDEQKCVSSDTSEIEQCCLEFRDTPVQWKVDRLVFIGAVRDISGNLVNVLAFKAGLRSGHGSCEIEVRVGTQTLTQLLERIEPGAIREPRLITKVLKDLLATALSSRNGSFDPQHASQWELGGPSTSSLAPVKARRQQQ